MRKFFLRINGYMLSGRGKNECLWLTLFGRPDVPALIVSGTIDGPIFYMLIFSIHGTNMTDGSHNSILLIFMANQRTRRISFHNL